MKSAEPMISLRDFPYLLNLIQSPFALSVSSDIMATCYDFTGIT
jgi:hypothetical protein